jgi:hypothetical protein
MFSPVPSPAMVIGSYRSFPCVTPQTPQCEFLSALSPLVHWPIGPWDNCWWDFEKDDDWNDALYGVCALTPFYAKALRILAEFSRRTAHEHPASAKSSTTTALFQRCA